MSRAEAEEPVQWPINWIKAPLSAGIIAGNRLKSVTWDWTDKYQMATRGG